MKSGIKNLILIASLAVAFASCDKKEDIKAFGNGTMPVLTASSATVAPAATDSNNIALTLSWTYPAYATDSANTKYTIEIDSTGKNFAAPLTKVISKNLSASFIAKELNTLLLSKGYAFTVPVDMEVRVISSYANNNERLASNVVRVKMTPYKIPPKIALPASGKLFIVGSATAGGWNNPVPAPSQEFARMDETTFGGIFQLTAAQSYALLPVNGDWTIKYGANGSNNSNNSNGDDFKLNGGDMLAPATTGWYKVIVNYQTGKFTVTPYTGTLPTTLFLVGDATAWGWNNPVPVASQQFTRVNSSVWELTVPMIGGKEFLVLSTNGDWSKKYTLKDNSVTGISSGGEFGYHQDGQPAPDVFISNFKGPLTSGTFKVTLSYVAPTTIAGASGKFTIQ